MAKPVSRIRLYRAAALLAFILAQLVVLAIPMKMQEPDDWAFRYAAQNFAHGRFTIEDSLYIQQSQEVWESGGQLLGYAKVSDDHWALTRAPGFVFYLVPFQQAGLPQLGASILSLGLAAVLYLLLARLKDEKTALFGIILLLSTPLHLAMWQRVYMDSLAALATAGMGGGLYLYYWLSRGRLTPRMCAVVLFLSGFLLAATVAVRYTNITITAVFGLHFLIMAVRAQVRQERFLPAGLVFILGAALPFTALLIYHGAVFGSPFSCGDEFSQLPINFAWEYIGEGMAYQIIRNNVIQLWAPLLLAMPVLLIAVPVFGVVSCKKIVSLVRRADDPYPGFSGWLLVGWVLAVFLLYAMYEWTAYQEAAHLPFTIMARFYLPALFPLVVVSALALARMPAKLRGSILAVAASLGVLFFIQAVRIQIQFTVGVTPPSLNAPAAAEPSESVYLIASGEEAEG